MLLRHSKDLIQHLALVLEKREQKTQGMCIQICIGLSVILTKIQGGEGQEKEDQSGPEPTREAGRGWADERRIGKMTAERRG